MSDCSLLFKNSVFECEELVLRVCCLAYVMSSDTARERHWVIEDCLRLAAEPDNHGGGRALAGCLGSCPGLPHIWHV